MTRDGARRHRVGVFGGTFDPPHVAHLVAAVRAAEELDLDVVLMVVANVPWQKVGSRSISAAGDRLEMVRRSVVDEPLLAACDLELRRGGDSYTVDTLDALRASDPEVELVLILGTDAANGLDTWERADRLASLCRLAVVDRPGAPLVLPEGFAGDVVPMPRLEISSSDLRRRVAEGRSIRFLVPDGAVALIEERRLYRVGHDDDRP